MSILGIVRYVEEREREREREDIKRERADT
jgi:hypothetical protein